MRMLQVLTLWETLEDYSNKLKEWIFANYSNPLLWIGLVGGGFLIFKAVYSALNNEK